MELVFTADKKLLPILIRYFTKRSWLKTARTSHVILRYGGVQSNWLVEANEKGFWPNWWNKFKKTHNIIRRYEVIGCEEAFLEKYLNEFVDEKIGAPYDDSGLIGMSIVILCYWITGKKIKNPLGKSGGFTCSETVYRFFDKIHKELGIRYFKEQNAETTFPEDLLIQCESNPDKFKLRQ